MVATCFAARFGWFRRKTRISLMYSNVLFLIIPNYVSANDDIRDFKGVYVCKSVANTQLQYDHETGKWDNYVTDDNKNFEMNLSVQNTGATRFSNTYGQIGRLATIDVKLSNNGWGYERCFDAYTPRVTIKDTGEINIIKYVECRSENSGQITINFITGRFEVIDSGFFIIDKQTLHPFGDGPAVHIGVCEKVN